MIKFICDFIAITMTFTVIFVIYLLAEGAIQ